MSSRIEEILRQRRVEPIPDEEMPAGEKFFSILLGEGIQENFLELQFRNGLQTCFNYTDLIWFSHDPEEGCVEMEFGGFLVTIKGRGLKPLFRGIKAKRVAWIKEADSSLQDHKDNESFVEEISIKPPNGVAMAEDELASRR